MHILNKKKVTTRREHGNQTSLVRDPIFHQSVSNCRPHQFKANPAILVFHANTVHTSISSKTLKVRSRLPFQTNHTIHIHNSYPSHLLFTSFAWMRSCSHCHSPFFFKALDWTERRERFQKEFLIQITWVVSAGMRNFWGQLSSWLKTSRKGKQTRLSSKKHKAFYPYWCLEQNRSRGRTYLKKSERKSREWADYSHTIFCYFFSCYRA